MKKYIKIITVLSLVMVTGSCKKTNFDDPTYYTLTEASEKVKDYALKLATGNVQSVMFAMTDYQGIHLGLMADQSTTTNRYLEFWDWCQEPRKTINNTKSYGAYAVLNDYYKTFYNANLNANVILDVVEVQGKPALDASGNDRTQDVLAAAYFIKAVSQGYLGAIYDKGIVVNDLSASTIDFPDSYKDLITSSMVAFDKAIQIAGSNSNFNFDFMTSAIPISKTDFIKLSNSLAARILASVPRDKAEGLALGATHWQKVSAYAANGFTADYTIPSDPNIYYHNYYDWINFRLGDGSAYIPVDIKLAWLIDNTHPKYYPGSGVLPAVTTSDARFYSYFGYDEDFGYLRADRNRGLFSNYYRKRWDYNGNQWMGEAGTPNPIVLQDEMRFLKAEAALFQGNFAAAAGFLNEAGSKRKSVGALADVAATENAVRYALHYEYSIEIDGAASVLNPWVFMRRHDLLIGGTPTELPLPQEQLQLVGKDVYSFGGSSNFGAKGSNGETATAANVGWKASQ